MSDENRIDERAFTEAIQGFDFADTDGRRAGSQQWARDLLATYLRHASTPDTEAVAFAIRNALIGQGISLTSSVEQIDIERLATELTGSIGQRPSQEPETDHEGKPITYWGGKAKRPSEISEKTPPAEKSEEVSSLSPSRPDLPPADEQPDGRTYPRLLSEDEKKSLLEKAENLWRALEENNLGGFSGINRPFLILNEFRETIEQYGCRDTGLTWSANDLRKAKPPERESQPLHFVKHAKQLQWHKVDKPHPDETRHRADISVLRINGEPAHYTVGLRYDGLWFPYFWYGNIGECVSPLRGGYHNRGDAARQCQIHYDRIIAENALEDTRKS